MAGVYCFFIWKFLSFSIFFLRMVGIFMFGLFEYGKIVDFHVKIVIAIGLIEIQTIIFPPFGAIFALNRSNGGSRSCWNFVLNIFGHDCFLDS